MKILPEKEGTPCISVIMPCHNAEKHIRRSVESALGQTFSNIEVLVVDDGSTDASPHVIEDFSDPRLTIICQANRGVSAARNRGLSEARGEFVAFLDADDTWDPTCLEKLHRALEGEAHAVLAYCGWQNVGLSDARGRPYVPPDCEGEAKAEILLQGCPWPIHAALTRRASVERAGGFDEGLTNSEDYRLWLSIASGNRTVRVPEVLAYYHFHEGAQASRYTARAAAQNLRVKLEFLRQHPEVEKRLGQRKVRELTLGTLLEKGYECYWERDLSNARPIFRMVMKNRYGGAGDWKYMLPSLLPHGMHQGLLRFLDHERREERTL